MSIYAEKKSDPLCVDQVEAARLLGGVSPRTIRRWEIKKLITGRRIGKKKMYPYEQLKRLALGTTDDDEAK